MIRPASIEDYRSRYITSLQHVGILYSFARGAGSIVSIDKLLVTTMEFVMENFKPDETIIAVSGNGGWLVATREGIRTMAQTVTSDNLAFDGMPKRVTDKAKLAEDPFLTPLGIEAANVLSLPLALSENGVKEQLGVLALIYNEPTYTLTIEDLILTLGELISLRIKVAQLFENERLRSAEYARRTEEALNLHKIKEKTHWILGIIDEAAENFDNEDERFISLAQTRRVLREQVWTLCTGQLQQRRRIITFIINAISRTTAKDVTVDGLTSLKNAVSALAEEYIEPARFEQIEDTMLSIGS